MTADEKRISLKIDVNSGTIEIDAPADSFDQAIEKTRELTSSLELRKREDRDVAQNSDLGSGASEERSKSNAGASSERGRSGKPVKGTSSTGRPGRIGSFTQINELLSEEQQQTIRAFRTAKAPRDNGDEVLVALHQGEQLLNRQGFGYNEIYTLMWRAGTRPLPKALDEVLRLLVQQQFVERGKDGFYLKFLGRERVERELPTAKKQEE